MPVGDDRGPDRRRGTREVVAAPRRRSFSQSAERHGVQSLFPGRIPRRIRADDRAHRDDRDRMVFDHEEPKAVRQGVSPNRRQLEGRRGRRGWPRRPVDLLRMCVRGQRKDQRKRRSTSPSMQQSNDPPAHGRTRGPGAGGVTFVYGRFGLLIRSSLPAGTRLITTRPGVMY